MKGFMESLRDDVLASLAPHELRNIVNEQTAIPRLAKKTELIAKIERILPKLPTIHRFYRTDATSMTFLKPESVHLIVTSPPYWTLKKYHDREGQLGHISEYDNFLK
jgi:hypothetical protein